MPEKLSFSAGTSKYKVLMFLFFSLKDFMRCVTASIIFFIISIIAVSKYADGSSKAAGVKTDVLIFIIVYINTIYGCPVTSVLIPLWSLSLSFVSQIFGFIATIVFALDFYLIFNELANFLKQGGESNEEPSRQQGNIPHEYLIHVHVGTYWIIDWICFIYGHIVWSNVCFFTYGSVCCDM